MATTINADIVLTNKGREMITRFLANYDSWVSSGYKLWAHSKWGEGGWVDVDGTKEPKSASNFKDNSDLEIVLNPNDYSGSSYASSLIPIEPTNELVYESGGSDILRVRSVLETTEENDKDPGSSGNQNPIFWEVGVFDNASTLQSYNEDHMILYGIMDSGKEKNQNRAFEVNHRIPY